jgi:DNA polymerase III subunit delta
MYSNLENFKKKLQAAELNPCCCLVLVPVEAERKKICAEVVAHLRQKNPDLRPLYFEAGDAPLEKILAQSKMGDLFETEPLIIIEKGELLKKEEYPLLTPFLTPSLASVHFILSAASLKQGAEWGEEVLTINLTHEKPWERQRRLNLWLTEEAKREGKILEQEALSLLFERVGLDILQLEQELAKLICFVGERSHILLQDVRLMSSSSERLTGWQVAESLIWEETPLKEEPPFDLSLVGQVRYHLQLGLQMSMLPSKEAIVKALPSLRPKSLERYLPIVQKRGSSFFVEGLKALFELEMACKGGSHQIQLFWTRFKARL